jgi:drug/metabolite transporter (DMT)-like permease
VDSVDALFPPGAPRPWRRLVLAWGALLWIYALWGTSLIALRVVLEHLPPFLTAGWRYAAAAVILVAAALIVERPSRIAWADLRRYALTGVVMFLGGNGLLSYGVQYVPVGTAAVLMATIPLWMVAFETIQGRLRPDRLTGLGLLGGVLGVAVLAGPSWGGQTDVVASVMILLGAASWAIGSLGAHHHAPRHGPLTVVAIQMIAGSLALLGVAAAFGEMAGANIATVPGIGWAALAWLVVPAGVITFASYTYALRVLPASVVATYPLVNTAVAVALGWIILAESITFTTIFGLVLVLAGAGVVALRFPSRERPAVAA